MVGFFAMLVEIRNSIENRRPYRFLLLDFLPRLGSQNRQRKLLRRIGKGCEQAVFSIRIDAQIALDFFKRYKYRNASPFSIEKAAAPIDVAALFLIP